MRLTLADHAVFFDLNSNHLVLRTPLLFALIKTPAANSRKINNSRKTTKKGGKFELITRLTTIVKAGNMVVHILSWWLGSDLDALEYPAPLGQPLG